jgi:hypothetical protein
MVPRPPSSVASLDVTPLPQPHRIEAVDLPAPLEPPHHLRRHEWPIILRESGQAASTRSASFWGVPLSGFAVAAAGDAPATFKITTKRADDSVEVKAEKDKTVFNVKSPFGISQAVFERKEATWPKAVVLRLHLKGLESFRASNGKVKLGAAVSIQEGKTQMRMWKDGKEDASLDEKSPLWTAIRIVGGDGKPARELPLRDGYFEVALPRAVFEGNPKSITVKWIDFYRN